MNMNDDTDSNAPTRTSTLGPGEAGLQQSLNGLTQAQDQEQHHHQLPPMHHRPTSQPQQYYQQAPYYLPIDSRSPEVYPASYLRSPMAANNAMDPTSFEAFRATPDPYAPMYGLPPPSVASSSTPQSPTFSHHGHQNSDPGMFMYPNIYPHNMTNMTGMPSQSMVSPRQNLIGGLAGHRAPQLPSGMPSTSNTTMMMQGMSPYPQSPMLMSPGTSGMDRLNKREVHPTDSFQGPGQIPGSSFGLANQWTASPTLGGAQGFMHGNTPSWSGHIDGRSVGGHQRMVSGPQPYLTNSMTFHPGSMSPPTSFFRPPNSGRMGMHSRSPSSFSQFSQQRTPQIETQRSPLLEEFRSRHNKSRHFELSDIRGSVVEFSSDQHGSRFTQEKLDTATEEETRMVFNELLPSSLALMTDVFGNYVSKIDCEECDNSLSDYQSFLRLFKRCLSMAHQRCGFSW